MKDSADEAMSGLMRKCGLSGRELSRVVLTGYGRAAFPGRGQITEITCHVPNTKNTVLLNQLLFP
jgi:activator of 2-hydroxyglutaryl-CoA dehydratase